MRVLNSEIITRLQFLESNNSILGTALIGNEKQVVRICSAFRAINAIRPAWQLGLHMCNHNHINQLLVELGMSLYLTSTFMYSDPISGMHISKGLRLRYVLYRNAIIRLLAVLIHTGP